MSEIEKAREALVDGLLLFRDRELIPQFVVRDIFHLSRAIAREEIEAAKGARPADPDWRCPLCGERECRGHGAAEASSLNWREFTALDAEDKSPPAVEAPAAGDSQEMADRLRSIARDPNNFITRAGSLIEAASMLADTTALARRLAEELSKIAGHVVVSETAIEALAEARKRGLIE